MKTPKTKRDITKQFMLDFIKRKKTSEEDKKWFASLCLENKVEKINNLTKEKYEDINIPVVREAFCKKFYPALVNDKKATFLEEIEMLNAKKEEKKEKTDK